MDTNKNYNDPSIIQAIWAVDSEDGREYLINLATSEVIAERVNGKIVDPNKWENSNLGFKPESDND